MNFLNLFTLHKNFILNIYFKLGILMYHNSMTDNFMQQFAL